MSSSRHRNKNRNNRKSKNQKDNKSIITKTTIITTSIISKHRYFYIENNDENSKRNNKQIKNQTQNYYKMKFIKKLQYEYNAKNKNNLNKKYLSIKFFDTFCAKFYLVIFLFSQEVVN